MLFIINTYVIILMNKKVQYFVHCSDIKLATSNEKMKTKMVTHHATV